LSTTATADEVVEEAAAVVADPDEPWLALPPLFPLLLPPPLKLLLPPALLDEDAPVDFAPAAVVVTVWVEVTTTVLRAIVAVLQNVSVSNPWPLAGAAWAEKVVKASTKSERQVDFENMAGICVITGKIKEGDALRA
jgi:hypothetical protein